MRRIAILCATFVFVAFFSGSAFSQEKSEDKKDSALLATWEITISAQGQEFPGSLVLEKDGDSYKGSLTTMLGDAPFKNVKIKEDNTFTADIVASVQGQTMEGTVSGKLDGEKFSGEITLNGFGSFPFSGKKTEKK